MKGYPQINKNNENNEAVKDMKYKLGKLYFVFNFVLSFKLESFSKVRDRQKIQIAMRIITKREYFWFAKCLFLFFWYSQGRSTIVRIFFLKYGTVHVRCRL